MLPQSLKRLAAAGQNLVGIGLMADVPDDLVLGRVKDVVNGDGQLHSAQARGQVTAVARDHFDDEVADLGGQLRQLARAAVCLRSAGDWIEFNRSTVLKISLRMQSPAQLQASTYCHFFFQHVAGDGPQGIGLRIEVGNRLRSPAALDSERILLDFSSPRRAGIGIFPAH